MVEFLIRFKIKEEGGREIIFDAFSKINGYALTPEEWVAKIFR